MATLDLPRDPAATDAGVVLSDLTAGEAAARARHDRLAGIRAALADVELADGREALLRRQLTGVLGRITTRDPRPVGQAATIDELRIIDRLDDELRDARIARLAAWTRLAEAVGEGDDD